MPNANTFDIPPIRDFVKYYLARASRSIDPFARNGSLADVTNDLNPDTSAMYHMDAEDFLVMAAELEQRDTIRCALSTCQGRGYVGIDR